MKYLQQILSYGINYLSGTLDQGHYWVVIKDLNLGEWLPCNGKVILTVPQHQGHRKLFYNGG